MRDRPVGRQNAGDHKSWLRNHVIRQSPPHHLETLPPCSASLRQVSPPPLSAAPEDPGSSVRGLGLPTDPPLAPTSYHVSFGVSHPLAQGAVPRKGHCLALRGGDRGSEGAGACPSWAYEALTEPGPEPSAGHHTNCWSHLNCSYSSKTQGPRPGCHSPPTSQRPKRRMSTKQRASRGRGGAV